MAIRIDSSLAFMAPDARRQLERDVGSGRRGPISDAVLPLNSELLRRQEAIDLQRRRIDALEERIKRLQDPGYTLDALDEFDLCNAWAGLPVEWYVQQEAA